MKILLLGKNGQVGWELQRSLAPLGELVALGSAELDLADAGALDAALRELAPDVIANAAAYTAVDRAEAEPALAHALNAEAPGALARFAAARGAWLLHYSSDYVFDGSGNTPWREDDAAAPLNAYGRSKLAGEDAIRASGCRHLILRTSWVHGARGANFAKTMLRFAAERERLNVVDDQFGAPTGAELLADLGAQLLRDALRRPGLAGTYHAAAGGETSWHGYARHVIEFARAAGQPVRVAPEAVIAVPTSAFPTPARRPANSRLNTRKLRDTFGLTLPDWRVGVDRVLAELFAH